MNQLQSSKVSVFNSSIRLSDKGPPVSVSVEGSAANALDLEALTQLVGAAGGSLELGSAQAGEPESNGPQRLSFTAHSADPSQHFEQMDQNFMVYDLQGLRGVLAAPRPELSLILLGVPTAVQPQDLAVMLGKTPVGAPAAAIGIDSSISAAEALAGNPQWRNARVTSLFREASALQAGDFQHELLVVPIDCVEALAFRAGKQTGTSALLSRLEVRSSSLCARWIGNPDESQQEPDPSGALLALVKLLQGLGQHRAAQQLQDAWLVTLEEGFHTGAFKHIAPYTQQVSSAAFLERVHSALGQRPKRLPGRELLPPAPSRTKLQLVG